MTREIKFRVWDGKEMSSQIRLGFAHGLRLVSTSDLGFDMTGDDKCILMQYTGLIDIKGKEICEGDIIKATPNEINKNIRFLEVKYETHRIGDFFNWEIIGFRDYSKSTYGYDIEVVGNIYENNIIELENYANTSECYDAPVVNGRCYKCKENV